jgi:hypothetical protein
MLLDGELTTLTVYTGIPYWQRVRGIQIRAQRTSRSGSRTTVIDPVHLTSTAHHKKSCSMVIVRGSVLQHDIRMSAQPSPRGEETGRIGHPAHSTH